MKFNFYLIVYVILITIKLSAQSLSFLPSIKYFSLDSTDIIEVQVENVLSLRAYSIQISYDRDYVKCIGVTKTSFFSNYQTFFYSKIDTIEGTILIDEAILGMGFQSGSGILFQLKFKAIQLGSSQINFSTIDFRDTLNQNIIVSSTSGSLIVVPVLSINDNNYKKNELQLLQNFPNPFNSFTSINFITSSSEKLYINIYDILGRLVYEDQIEKPIIGFNSATWNGKDKGGNNVASTNYYLIIKQNGIMQSIKIVLLK
jgi:hypothetical protein